MPKKQSVKRSSKKTQRITSINQAISNGVATADTQATGLAIISSVTNISLLDGLLDATTGTLPIYPQRAVPSSYGAGVTRLKTKVFIHFAEVYIKFVGAQSSILASGDLYNTCRSVMALVGPSYSDSYLSPLNGVDIPINLNDVQHLYHDKTYLLPMTAFDSASGYNAPNMKSYRANVPIHRALSCHSTTTTGAGAVWDTKEYNLILSFISDSGVTPHPACSYFVRLYYSYID